jgi:hypothetical protein
VDAAFTSDFPLSPGGSSAAFIVYPAGAAEPVSIQAAPRIVSHRYFATLKLPVVAGRAFTAEDRTGPPVMIVNRTFARRYLNDNAVGVRMPMAVGYGGEQTTGTVVGVVDDVRYVNASQTSLPEVFYPFEQLGGRLPIPVVTMLVRSNGHAEALAPVLQDAVRGADPQLKAEGVMSFEDRMLATLARPRLYAVLLTGFAALGLFVAGVGLFGMLTYTVAQRTREIAVRSALGAKPRDLTWLVVRQGLIITMAGLLIGVPLSFWAGRLSASLLYGVAPFDPLTFALVPGVIVVIALMACLAPARRAARLDPARVLR